MKLLFNSLFDMKRKDSGASEVVITAACARDRNVIVSDVFTGLESKKGQMFHHQSRKSTGFI